VEIEKATRSKTAGNIFAAILFHKQSIVSLFTCKLVEYGVKNKRLQHFAVIA
jgi:hypothetical protein